MLGAGKENLFWKMGLRYRAGAPGKSKNFTTRPSPSQTFIYFSGRNQSCLILYDTPFQAAFAVEPYPAHLPFGADAGQHGCLVSLPARLSFPDYLKKKLFSPGKRLFIFVGMFPASAYRSKPSIVPAHFVCGFIVPAADLVPADAGAAMGQKCFPFFSANVQPAAG